MKNVIQLETEISNLPDLNTIAKSFRLPLHNSQSYPKLLKPNSYKQDIMVEEMKQGEITKIIETPSFVQKSYFQVYLFHIYLQNISLSKFEYYLSQLVLIFLKILKLVIIILKFYRRLNFIKFSLLKTSLAIGFLLIL